MERSLERGQQTLRFIAALLREHAGYMAAAIALAALSRGAALVLPISTRYLVDTVLRQHREDLLLAFVGFIGAAIAVQSGTAYLLNSLVARRSNEIACDLRIQTVRHALRLPLSFLDANASGASATRIANDCDSIRHVFGFPMIDLVSATVTGLISIVVLLRINSTIAGIGVAMLMVSAAGFAGCVWLSRGYVRERSVILADANGQLAETLGGIRTIRAFVAEHRAENAYRERLDALLRNVNKTTRLSSYVAVARIVIGGSTGLLLTWVGVHEIASGRLTVGGLLVAVVLWAMMAGALIDGGAASIQISESLAGMDRLRDLLAQRCEGGEHGRTTTFRSGLGRVVFDNVSFAFGRGVPVLSAVSFELAPRTITALVGPSGAGKSTVAAIAAGLYSPTSGRVLVDGYDLRTVRLESYRGEIGFVPQDATLMSGSIRDNIALGRAATEAEFRWACRVARVNEFCDQFPGGYDTEIGERGVQLSGGQRQRIAIARALLGDPRILILDEPTASLDDASAEMVHDALFAAAEGRTTILISHSPAEIRRADRVLVLEHGRVIERGVPAEVQRIGGLLPEAESGHLRFSISQPPTTADAIRPIAIGNGS